MSLDESKNNYIMGIFFDGDKYGLSIADVTTADFFVTEVDSNRSCLDEINKYVPSEIICNENFTISGIDIADLKERMQISIAKLVLIILMTVWLWLSCWNISTPVGCLPLVWKSFLWEVFLPVL